MSSSEELNVQVIGDENVQFDLTFKIIIVGDSGVGKSCLSLRAIKNYFEDFYSPTIGFEFLSYNLQINDKKIKLQLWDTCGQEAYRSLITSFYKNSSLAIMVYSVDSEQSFNNIETWLNDIKTQSSPDIKIILIGNKVDLEDKRQVTKAEGEDFCKSHDLNFFCETSAKTGFNAENLFIEAGKILYKEHIKTKDNITRPGSLASTPYVNGMSSPVLIDEEEERPSKKGCCQ